MLEIKQTTKLMRATRKKTNEVCCNLFPLKYIKGQPY